MRNLLLYFLELRKKSITSTVGGFSAEEAERALSHWESSSPPSLPAALLPRKRWFFSLSGSRGGIHPTQSVTWALPRAGRKRSSVPGDLSKGEEGSAGTG